MTDSIHTLALALPSATHVGQWQGCDVYKVGGKVFAIFVPPKNRLTVKCDSEDTARMLIEVGAAVRAPHLPRGGWVAFDAETLNNDECATRICASYEVVRSALPRRLQADMAASE